MMRRSLAIVLALGGFLMATAAVAAPAPSFPGVPVAPPMKGATYGGFFRDHQPVKVVFGVSDPGAQLKESLTNAALVIRDLRARGYRYRLQVVLYGTAVYAVDEWKPEYSIYHDLMQRLHASGVQFRVCYNSMYSLHVKSDDIYPFVKVVPAGILQIVKKEMQGYAYIVNR